MRQRCLNLCIAAGTIAVLAYLGRQYFGDLSRLREASRPMLVGILLLYLLTRFVHSEVVRQALVRLGHHVGRYETFMLNMLMSYTNLLIPRAGLGAPAMYLNRKYHVSYSDYASVVMVNVVLQLLCGGAAGLAYLTGMWLWRDIPVDRAVGGLFLVAMLFGLAAATFRLTPPESWQGRLARFARRLNDSWKLLKVDRTVIARTLTLQFVILLLRAARLQLAFLSLGESVSFDGAFIASLLADFTLLVSITPSAMGLREGAIIYSAGLMGTIPSVALSAAILDRVVWTLGVVVVAQIGMWQFLVPTYRKSRAGQTLPSNVPGALCQPYDQHYVSK